MAFLKASLSVVDLIGKLNLEDENINTWKNGVVRALKTFIADGTKVSDHTCTECGDESLVYEEGCLSLPGLRADIVRPDDVVVRFIDVNGKERKIEANGLLARVIQHEYDHLEGKLIPDRVSLADVRKVRKMLQKIERKKVEIGYPIIENK